MDGVKTQVKRKNRQLLLFPEPQGGPTREASSLERREGVVKAMKDFYRGRRK
jgi:hypothetical protein